ncbi:MAG: PIN domain-containing protein [Nitrososphaerales archaeon]
MILLDTFAWIEYFSGSEQGKIVKDYLNDDPISSSISLAEISRKYSKEGFKENEVRRRLLFIASKSLLKEISIDVAFTVVNAYKDLHRNAKKEHLNTPSLADAIILATARIEGVKVVTGDPHFKGLKETEYIGI